MIIDNKPGAGGNIGADFVAKSAPDGYNIVVGTVGTHSINGALYPKMPYDMVKEFSPITLLATTPNMLVVHNDVPANTPKTIVTKPQVEIAKILKSPDISKRLLDLGLEPIGSTPEELAAYQRSEIVKWAKVVKDSGAKLE